MKPSEKCYAIIKHFEGCKLQAYQCSAGVWTIGYGNTFFEDGKPVRHGDSITKERAESMINQIVEKFAIGVDQLVKRHIQQNEFDALVSFCYNVGIGNLEKSTLLKKVNANADVQKIEDEFMKWNKVKGKELAGLTRRRKAEATLYRYGIEHIS